MINFRYHLLSLVAVFLALAIGIVMGSTVIDRAIVDGLRNRIDTAEKNSVQRKSENDRLKTAMDKLDDQDSVLAGHAVKGSLANQTVYVVTIGDVDNDVRVETQELLAVSGARLASVIRFSNDFLNKDIAKTAKDMKDDDAVHAIFGSEKNKASQVAQVFNTFLTLQAGGPSNANVSTEQVLSFFDKYNAFTQQEKATSFDPVQNISVLLLVNRTDLQNKNIADFAAHFYSGKTLTIGLVGSDTDNPSRSDAIDAMGSDISDLSIVDNAESPSGRAALFLAHSLNIGGTHQIYGVSNKAKSPAPDVNS
jgi:hypothetical protein